MDNVIETAGAAWAHREEILAWIATVVLALSATVKALQIGAHALERYAMKTASKSDDEPARTLVRWADGAASWLDRLASWIRPLSLYGRGRNGNGKEGSR